MATENLNPAEFRRIKTLLSSPDTMPMADKISALETLRTKCPDLFPGMTEERLKNNNFLLRYLSDSFNKQKIKKYLKGIDSLSITQKTELEEALNATQPAIQETAQLPDQEVSAEQAAPTEQATGASESGTSGGSMFGGGGGGASSSGRIIHNIPHAPEEKPDIAIAGKSGQVIEKGDPSKLVTADRSGEIVEKGQPSQLVTANRSGQIAEPGQPSKLVTTSGGVVKEPPPSKIFTSNRSENIIKEHNIPSQTRFNSAAFKSAGRRVGDEARKGLERANPFLKSAGNNLLKGLGGIANPNGAFMGAGGGGIFGSLGRIGRGGRSAASSLGKKIKNRRWLIFALGMIGFMFLIGGITITAPQEESTSTTGTSSFSSLLDYTLPVKDTSVTPTDIRDQIRAAFPSAKIEYWDKIIQSSIAAGFNPALALALWIEETGASQATVTRNGGGGIPNADGNFALGHLGCAPLEDQTIDESLTCLFKFAAQFTNDQFEQFMATYSGGPPEAPFSNNPYFTSNIKTWYSRLVPTGTGAIQAVSQPSGNLVFYCQNDARWAGTSYGCQTISQAGCGPTTLAIVLSSLTTSTDPVQASQLLLNGNFGICFGGNDMQTRMEAALLDSSFLASIGLEGGPVLTSGGNLDLQAAQSYISRGYLIVGSSDRFPLCNCGHIFVVQSVNPNAQTVYIRDPNNCSSSGTENSGNREYSASSFIWKYAYPVKAR